MSSVGRRPVRQEKLEDFIERTTVVKDMNFYDVLVACVGGEIDLPDREDLPTHILCPFHSERTPSCHLSEDLGWYCFGCGRCGDVISFVMEFRELSFEEALCRVEKDVGIDDVSDDELERLIVLADRRRRKSQRPGEKSWRLQMHLVEDVFCCLIRPYAFNLDPLVSCLADPVMHYVCDELSSIRHPRTVRGFEEGVRNATRWSMGMLRMVENQVEVVTGKDRVTVLLQEND